MLRGMHAIRDTSVMSTNSEIGVAPWVPDTTCFGARLALVRQHQKWNMKEAALACGIKQNSWREWELSERLPRDFPTICEQIAQRTGVDIVWLMTGRWPLSPPPGNSHTPEDDAAVIPLANPKTPRRVEIDDDALNYVALVDGLPRVDSNHQPSELWFDRELVAA